MPLAIRLRSVAGRRPVPCSETQEHPDEGDQDHQNGDLETPGSPECEPDQVGQPQSQRVQCQDHGVQEHFSRQLTPVGRFRHPKSIRHSGRPLHVAVVRQLLQHEVCDIRTGDLPLDVLVGRGKAVPRTRTRAAERPGGVRRMTPAGLAVERSETLSRRSFRLPAASGFPIRRPFRTHVTKRVSEHRFSEPTRTQSVPDIVRPGVSQMKKARQRLS